MKSKKTFLVMILAFVLFLAGASALYNQIGKNLSGDRLEVLEQWTQSDSSGAQNSSTDAERVKAPDFIIYDEEGQEVRLSDYIGNPIILNFWASWCGPCQMEMPDFQEKYLELGQEVHFLMINMTDGSRETVDSARKFISEQKYTFPVFFDTAYHATIAYEAYALPMTFFIDREGYAIAQATGAIDGETLQRGIDMILGK